MFLRSRVNRFCIFTGISQKICILARHGTYWPSNGPSDNSKDFNTKSSIGGLKELFQILRIHSSSHIGIIDPNCWHSILQAWPQESFYRCSGFNFCSLHYCRRTYQILFSRQWYWVNFIFIYLHWNAIHGTVCPCTWIKLQPYRYIQYQHLPKPDSASMYLK